MMLVKHGEKPQQRGGLNFFSSYGYYFAQIRVHPKNKDQIYLLGVSIVKSSDSGKTLEQVYASNVHADHHALWINPELPGHLIDGNDGGINISYDNGANWTKNNWPSVGQFYAINVDDEKPYNVYGGLQDNGVWLGPNYTYTGNVTWQQTGQYPWKRLLRSDGMQIQIDNRNSNIVYAGNQFGNYFRIDREKNKFKKITPVQALGKQPYRFNWQTPILLSPHNQDILYLGTSTLHRSLNQGDTWETISDDLTNGLKAGNVSYGTLTTISESPFKFGLIYTGSDDGVIQVTKDAGGSWEKISNNFKDDKLWVSRVVASKYKKERVYATLNGYRWDDHTPYVYVSNDYGKSWDNIGATLPASPVNVIIEDTENENVLFVGTDNGLYISFNKGETWEIFTNGLPPVAVHDLVIQPRVKDLLVGTHGRGVYKTSLSKIQKITPFVLAKKMHLFKIDDDVTTAGSFGDISNIPEPGGIGTFGIHFYAAKAGTFTAKILTTNNIEVNTISMNAIEGLNTIIYDIDFSKSGKSNYLKKNNVALEEDKDGITYLPAGSYKIELSGHGVTESTPFEVKKSKFKF